VKRGSQVLVEVDEQLTLIRQRGRGAVVVALHPLPLSSRSLTTLVDALAGSFCVLTHDVPGHGLSAASARRLGDYSAWLLNLMDRLALDRCVLYGRAESAQIALAFACQHPERVALLLLDPVTDVDGQQQSTRVGPDPDLSPDVDGNHLVRLWQHSLTLQQSLMAADVSSATASDLHDIAMDLWLAGANGQRTEIAARIGPQADLPTRLTTPTRIIVGPGDSLPAAWDALLVPRPQSEVRLQVADAAPNARIRAVQQVLRIAAVDGLLTSANSGPLRLPPVRERRFHRARDGWIHLRERATGVDRPRLRLHALGSSMQSDPWQARAPVSGPWLAPDLPLHGDSSASFRCTPLSLAGAIAEAAREAGYLDALIDFDPSARAIADCLLDELPGAELMPHPPEAPPRAIPPWHALELAPERDGSHLQRAWHLARAHWSAQQNHRAHAGSAASVPQLQAIAYAALRCGAWYPTIMRWAYPQARL
jgi:pimeloyl-ACP methyl ester carboxylesterase